MRTLRLTTNSILFGVMIFASTAPSTQTKKFNVDLKINEDVTQFSGTSIASKKTGSRLSYTFPTSGGLGHAPGNVLIRIEEMNGPLHAYQIWVDSNGDGDLANEKPKVVLPGASIIAKVKRVAGKTLPFLIMYSREADQNGEIREHFLWIPNYRAEGRLKIKNCEALFVLLDLTNDGQFDSEDLWKGTNIGLDRNGDNRIWGKEEYLKGEQIIEYCGEGLLIDRVAVDGTSVTLATTTLRVPVLGDQLPTFSLRTLEGKTIDSKSLKNKVHLIDFWASWCKPCVEKFSLVERLSADFKDDLSIIAINVDEKSRMPLAREIIIEKRLHWPHVMDGLGEADPMWKVFGAIGGNRLAIPLYVLVDVEGRIRYAGDGGEELSALRLEIEKLLKRAR